MTPKNDAVAAGRIRKAGHGPGAAQHFPEGPLAGAPSSARRTEARMRTRGHSGVKPQNARS